MPIIIDDPNNPCNSLSNYGAPIKLQTSYYPTPYQQYQQPGQQYSATPIYQQPPTQPPPQPPISPPGYWPQANQTAQPTCIQPPRKLIFKALFQFQNNFSIILYFLATETPPAAANVSTHQSSLVCTCVESHLPYCPDTTVQYCPDTAIYCSDPNRQYKPQSHPHSQQQHKQSNHVKPVRLPTIYKNFHEPPRKGDEVIAEYEEVLSHERRPRIYSRPRCHSNRRHQSRGHEVLAEYTEVLDYRPRNYSRGRRSNDDWSDYDDYDSHYDQRSCDLYYNRSYDRSLDRSYEHSHSYDIYHENRRSSRRARSPGPHYYQKAYPNEQPPNVVNIDPKTNTKVTRQMYNGTPVQQKPEIYKSTEYKQQPTEYNDYRNAKSPVSSHPPRNLRTPRNPPPNFRQ